ncbi:MraY family glycosyltransferase [uncultured Draconibacterium sp.]|uniref:MraY family glycosyltransferase n=1 Tax=uncultured Draconibacterium sp. TaxID=1573823 RepID=UPI0032175CE7
MEILLILAAFILGFTIVIITVPPILRVAKAKRLYDSFDERKIHTQVVPPLGGIAIFIAFIISTIVASDGLTFFSLKYIIAAVMIMFFIGLKDDLLVISARKKLMIQIIAAILLITLGDIRFTNLHGILGTYQIHFFESFTITLFAIVGIINAFNLIDGIDGLASGLSMLAATVFGTWFYISGNYQLSIMSFALVGSVSAFFLYNVFGNTNKLFMGDTGSLIIGTIISILVIKFNELNISQQTLFYIGAAPSVSFAIIIVPLIDTLRVMSIRIRQKRSPFSPDNNHIHHRLLTLIPNHLKVTLIIVTVNVMLIAVALLFNHIGLNVNIQMVCIFLLGVALSFVPSILIKHKSIKKTTKAKIEYSKL